MVEAHSLSRHEPIMAEANTCNYSPYYSLYFCMWLKFSMIKFMNCAICYYSKFMIQREISLAYQEAMILFIFFF